MYKSNSSKKQIEKSLHACQTMISRKIRILTSRKGGEYFSSKKYRYLLLFFWGYVTSRQVFQFNIIKNKNKNSIVYSLFVLHLVGVNVMDHENKTL